MWRILNKNMQVFRVKIILVLLKVCMFHTLANFGGIYRWKKNYWTVHLRSMFFEVNFDSVNLSKSGMEMLLICVFLFVWLVWFFLVRNLCHELLSFLSRLWKKINRTTQKWSFHFKSLWKVTELLFVVWLLFIIVPLTRS